jgi:hypothetical protein
MFLSAVLWCGKSKQLNGFRLLIQEVRYGNPYWFTPGQASLRLQRLISNDETKRCVMELRALVLNQQNLRYEQTNKQPNNRTTKNQSKSLTARVRGR